MQAVVDFLKMLVQPASVGFFVFVIGVGVALSFVARTARVARWYFAALFAGYWVLTTPACAEWLISRSARAYTPISRSADARGARVIVVLGAGSNTIAASGLSLNQINPTAALRVLEGARLYHLLGQPTVILSGGVTSRETVARPEAEAMRDAALRLGVDPARVLLESESRTTREEAVVVRRMLGDRAREPILLVTSPTHMARSLAVFRATGLDPVPAVAPYKSEHTLERQRWLPSDVAVWLVTSVIYDKVAGWYYWTRGWY